MGIRSAIKLSLAMQVVSQLITFVNVLIIARLLTPEEVGVFAIVSSFTIIAVDLRFFGTGNFLVKEMKITEEKKRSVLGVSIVISYFLGIVLFSCASILSSYFAYADMTLLFQLTSLSFFIAPFVVVPHSMLMREYNFKALFIIICVSQLVSVVVTVYLISLGYSYFSLAITLNVAVICQLLLIYLISPSHLVFRPSNKQVKDIFQFGGLNSLSTILTRLSFVVPDLIIGKIGSARDVAMFSRGLGFTTFLSQVLTMGFRPIALPYLSESIHNNENVIDSYLRATNLIGSICLPVLSVASVSAYPIIMLLFGEQWIEAVPIVGYLSIWMAFKMIHVLVPPLFIASNKQKLLLYQTAIVFILTSCAIAFFYEYGLVTVAKIMAIVGFLEFILITYQLKLYFNLKFIVLIKSLFPNIILTITCLVTTYFLDLVMDFRNYSPLITLGFVAFVNICIWVSLTKILKLEIYNEVKEAILGIVVTR
jgi:O-antigen/teichoic acid export membrane protein